MDTVKDFYQPAKSVLQQELNFSRHQLASLPHPNLKLIQNEYDYSPPRPNYLRAQINQQSQLFILGSSEANALTTALFKLEPGFSELRAGLTQLIPARLHIGPARSLDNKVACFQGLQIPQIKSFFTEIEDPQQQLLLANLLREGQKAQVQEAVYYLFKQLPTNALINVSHQEDDSTPLGRIAVMDQPNLEGVNLDAVTHLVLSDSVASGVTHFYALKYFANKMPRLKRVLIVSPHLTKYGSLNLCRYADRLGLELLLLGYGALLSSRKPDLYFSPTPVNTPQYFVDPNQAELMELIYGDLAADLGVAGNWTAMFLSPVEGLKWFKQELAELGSTMADLRLDLDAKQVEEIGVEVRQLLPVSSLMETLVTR